MNDPVKFTFKKRSEKPILLESIPDDDTEYINNTSVITKKTNKTNKRKNLMIPHKGNLWKPGNSMDNLTKEAIVQLMNTSGNISENSPKAIGSSEKTSSLKFPGIVPQIESSVKDYKDVPVTSFGEALMRGMGWEKGKGIGRKRKFVEPIDFEGKKRTLGVTIHEEELAEANRIFHEFKLGDYIEVVGGQDKGKHAKILSLSLETARCIVRLPSEEVVDLALINITSGSREQYMKQRDLDQSNVDIFENPLGHSRPSRSDTSSVKTSALNGLGNEPWLHQDLRVRIVCQNFLDGKYYCKKVDVLDIVDSAFCVCRDMHGKLLEKVPKSILETVIPKEKGSLVMLLSGRYRLQVAELEEKDPKTESAICITLIDKDVISVSFDQVCQYVGNYVG